MDIFSCTRINQISSKHVGRFQRLNVVRSERGSLFCFDRNWPSSTGRLVSRPSSPRRSLKCSALTLRQVLNQVYTQNADVLHFCSLLVVGHEFLNMTSFQDFHNIFMAGGVKNITDPDHNDFLRYIFIQ